MREGDIAKLLGGYAAGMLTPAEREALFQEALGNQELFEALADEEALRDLLSDPASRARLLAGLKPAPAGFWSRAGAWLWRPVPLAAAGAVAVAVVALVMMRIEYPVPQTAEVAMVRRNEAPPLAGQSEPQPPATPARPEPQAAVPPPPPPPAPPPAAAAPPAMLAGSRAANEEKARDQSSAQETDEAAKTVAKQEGAVAAAAPQRQAAMLSDASRVPFRYQIQRLRQDGSYAVVSAGELKAGDSVRLAIDIVTSGRLTFSVGGQPPASRNVAGSERVYLPAEGFLASNQGDLSVALTWAAPAAIGGSIEAQGYRRSDAPASPPQPPQPYSLNFSLHFQ